MSLHQALGLLSRLGPLVDRAELLGRERGPGHRSAIEVGLFLLRRVGGSWLAAGAIAGQVLGLLLLHVSSVVGGPV